MLLTFLGTAASEGYPDAFCACENCRGAREAGGASLRKRSSALVDDDLLIDLGPDLMAASQIHAAPLDRVRYCLQTHEHADHLDVGHLHSRSPYCGVTTAPLLELCASRAVLGRLAAALGEDAPGGDLAHPRMRERLNLRVRAVAAGERFDVGPYHVTAVAAAHVPDAILFLIERDGRRLFYGTDTGPLPDETWALLAEDRRPLHVVVLDHTFGLRERSRGHMNADQMLEQVERMRSLSLVDAGTRILAHHIGHHSNPPHPQLAAAAAARGYEVAYDGLRVTV